MELNIQDIKEIDEDLKILLQNYAKKKGIRIDADRKMVAPGTLFSFTLIVTRKK